MGLNDFETHYSVLDVSSAATATEIREAYVRVKATYSRDGLALYTLISPEEREEHLKRIEDAYQVLSDHEKRRVYDQNHGFINAEASTPLQSSINPFESVFPSLFSNLGPAAPMDSDVAEDILQAPVTEDVKSDDVSTPEFKPTTPPPPPQPSREATAPTRMQPPPALVMETDPELLRRIDQETQWPGSLLRTIRESQHISIEEMATITKVSKTYLNAVEEENFAKLPAAVYVRGFVSQLARALRLPTAKIEPAVRAYMDRYNQYVQSKSS